MRCIEFSSYEYRWIISVKILIAWKKYGFWFDGMHDKRWDKTVYLQILWSNINQNARLPTNTQTSFDNIAGVLVFYAWPMNHMLWFRNTLELYNCRSNNKGSEIIHKTTYLSNCKIIIRHNFFILIFLRNQFQNVIMYFSVELKYKKFLLYHYSLCIMRFPLQRRHKFDVS